MTQHSRLIISTARCLPRTTHFCGSSVRPLNLGQSRLLFHPTSPPQQRRSQRCAVRCDAVAPSCGVLWVLTLITQLQLHLSITTSVISSHGWSYEDVECAGQALHAVRWPSHVCIGPITSCQTPLCCGHVSARSQRLQCKCLPADTWQVRIWIGMSCCHHSLIDHLHTQRTLTATALLCTLMHDLPSCPFQVSVAGCWSLLHDPAPECMITSAQYRA